MSRGISRISLVLFGIFALVPLQAAPSRQQADAFAKKIALIQQQGSAQSGAAARRTPVTQDELNSWFTYRAEPMLPEGVSRPQLQIVGQGKVAGEVTVDLEAIGRRRASGGTFDPWSYLGGRVPVTVSGILHTQDGRGRFELQTAEVSGVPVPKTILQELVSHYSRTPNNPDGFDLDDPFPLPANIDKIEVGQGQAVVVQ
jgi:hypothetical protein